MTDRRRKASLIRLLALPALVACASGVAQTADLAVTLDAFPDPVAPGQVLTHRIVVSNQGPDSAAQVQIGATTPSAFALGFPVPWRVPAGTEMSLSLPAGWSCVVEPPLPVFPTPSSSFICDVALLPAGSSATLLVTGRIRADVAGPVRMNAIVGGAAVDPDMSNNASGVIEVSIGVAAARQIPTASPATLWLLAMLLVASAFFGAGRLR